jgi:hypothetical protein
MEGRRQRARVCQPGTPRIASAIIYDFVHEPRCVGWLRVGRELPGCRA